MTLASPSESCPVCAAVASGGRIRLTEPTAQLLIAVLRDARRKALRERRVSLSPALHPSFLATANEQLKLIDSVMEEVERTQTEKGWPTLGQLQRPHP